jgi:MFS family permease
MGACVVLFYFVCRAWQAEIDTDALFTVSEFLSQRLAPLVLAALVLIAIGGGMFVVPLYAFLTTKVEPSAASRAVAANNIVNSGAMVIGSVLAGMLGSAGIPLAEQLLLSAAMCIVSAWLGWMLYRAESDAAALASELQIRQ